MAGKPGHFFIDILLIKSCLFKKIEILFGKNCYAIYFNNAA